MRRLDSATRELNAPPASKDIPMTITNFMAPTTGGRTIIINTLKTLLDGRIITPLRLFHARIVNNRQDHHIMKATVKPLLEQTAAILLQSLKPSALPTALPLRVSSTTMWKKQRRR